MPSRVQIPDQLAATVRAGDVGGVVDVLVKSAGYRRMEVVALVAAFMMVLASRQHVADEAEEADCEYRQLISRGLPPINSDGVAMPRAGEAHVACARYRRHSGASEEDTRTMIRLAAKMTATEDSSPAGILPYQGGKLLCGCLVPQRFMCARERTSDLPCVLAGNTRLL